MKIFVHVVKAHVVSMLISLGTVEAIRLQPASEETMALAQTNAEAEKSCGFFSDLFGMCPQVPEEPQANPNINIIDNARQMINGGQGGQAPININLDSGKPPPVLAPAAPPQVLHPNLQMPFPIPMAMPILPPMTAPMSQVAMSMMAKKMAANAFKGGKKLLGFAQIDSESITEPASVDESRAVAESQLKI